MTWSLAPLFYAFLPPSPSSLSYIVWDDKRKLFTINCASQEQRKKKIRERNIPWPTEHVCAWQSERPSANTRACTGPSRKLLTIQSCSKPNKTSPSDLVLQVEHFPEKWKSLFWVYHQAGIPDYISCLVQKKKISPQWNRVGFQTLQPTREGTFHGISQLNGLSPLNNLIKC